MRVSKTGSKPGNRKAIRPPAVSNGTGENQMPLRPRQAEPRSTIVRARQGTRAPRWLARGPPGQAPPASPGAPPPPPPATEAPAPLTRGVSRTRRPLGGGKRHESTERGPPLGGGGRWLRRSRRR